MMPSPWNVDLTDLAPDEHVYFDTYENGQLCNAKFKTSRPQKWIDALSQHFNTTPIEKAGKSGSTREIKATDINFLISIDTGVVLIQGKSFWKWVTSELPEIQALG